MITLKPHSTHKEPQMKLTNIIVSVFLLASVSANAASKLPTVNTYQPKPGVDAGCGKGKPVYTVDGKKFCKLPTK